MVLSDKNIFLLHIFFSYDHAFTKVMRKQKCLTQLRPKLINFQFARNLPTMYNVPEKLDTTQILFHFNNISKTFVIQKLYFQVP